jgi:hypothetical protein
VPESYSPLTARAYRRRRRKTRLSVKSAHGRTFGYILRLGSFSVHFYFIDGGKKWARRFFSAASFIDANASANASARDTRPDAFAHRRSSLPVDA